MKRKKIKVNINSEKTNKHQIANHQSHDFKVPYHQQQIGLKEETMINSSKSFAGEKKKQSREILKRFKPVIVAIMTALLLGLVFGFIFLRFFSTVDNGLAQPNDNPVIHLDTNEKESSETEKSAVTLPAIKAYIVQGGMFSEEANAKALAAEYEEKGVATIVWQEGKQYYVITGVTGSLETAEKLAEKQEENKIEVFTKEWTTSSTEIKLTQIEEEWLVSFSDLLVESINQSGTDEKLATDEWKTLLEQDTSDGDAKKVTSFRETIEPLTQAIIDDSLSENHYELLSLWFELERFLADSTK